jgi:hypothetical protein
LIKILRKILEWSQVFGHKIRSHSHKNTYYLILLCFHLFSNFVRVTKSIDQTLMNTEEFLPICLTLQSTHICLRCLLQSKETMMVLFVWSCTLQIMFGIFFEHVNSLHTIIHQKKVWDEHAVLCTPQNFMSTSYFPI